MIKIHSCLLKNVYTNLFPLYHFFLQSSTLTPPGPRATTNSNPPITEVVWKKSYLRKSLNGDCEWYIHQGFIQTFIMVSKRTNTKDASLVLYPTATRTIRIVPTTSCKMQTKENLNLMRVANMKPRRTRPVSCRYVFGVLPPKDGTPANKLFCSERDSARRSNKAPARARFLEKRKQEVKNICRYCSLVSVISVHLQI